MVNKKLIISFFLLNLSFGLFSQSPINLKSKVDTLSIKVGEKINYEFSFVSDSLNDFEFKLLKFNPPIDVIQDFKMDTLFNENKVEFVKKYSLTSFEAGTFSITPPIKIIDQIIKYQDSILINVSSVKVDTVSKKFFDIKNIYKRAEYLIKKYKPNFRGLYSEYLGKEILVNNINYLNNGN